MIILNLLLILKIKTLFFSDYSNENINGKIYKIYLAELIQSTCPYCRSTNLKHNGHYVSNVRFIITDASKPVTIKLRKQRVLCNDCLKRSLAQSNLVNKCCYIAQEHVVLDGLDSSKELENTYWVIQDFMSAVDAKDEK